MKPSPQPGPCKELCHEASVRDQTGEMSGETGGTTSTGGKSWQHSLQRVADATMLTQSLPKSLFVWVPSVAFFRVCGCSCTQSQWQTHTGSNPTTLCSFCQLEKEGWGISCFPCFLPPQKSLGYQTTTCVEKIEQVKMEKMYLKQSPLLCPGGAAISLWCLLKLWMSPSASAVIFVP